MHWAKRKQYRELIEDLIGYKTVRMYYSNKNSLPLIKAKIIFDIYFKTKRKRDIQNYLGGGLIAWLDALVYLNIIEDDCYDCIGQPIVNFYVSKICPRTEITIERR